MKNQDKASDVTGAAYKIVNSLLAPDLCGKTDVSDANKVAACDYVLTHWAKHGQGMKMPDDVRQLCECWTERWGEFFSD